MKGKGLKVALTRGKSWHVTQAPNKASEAALKQPLPVRIVLHEVDMLGLPDPCSCPAHTAL